MHHRHSRQIQLDVHNKQVNVHSIELGLHKIQLDLQPIEYEQHKAGFVQHRVVCVQCTVGHAYYTARSAQFKAIYSWKSTLTIGCAKHVHNEKVEHSRQAECSCHCYQGFSLHCHKLAHSGKAASDDNYSYLCLWNRIIYPKHPKNNTLLLSADRAWTQRQGSVVSMVTMYPMQGANGLDNMKRSSLINNMKLIDS